VSRRLRINPVWDSDPIADGGVLKDESVRSRRPAQSLLCFILTCLILSSCAPSTEQYKGYFESLSLNPSDGGVDPGPEKIIRKAHGSYGEKNEVLYDMDLGAAAQASGDYRTSEKAFRRADRLSRILYTKSVTNIIEAYQTNDLVIPYRGYPFERVMINLLNSLNYAETGDWTGALVETRKIRLKLQEYNQDYPKAATPPGKFAQYEGSAVRLMTQHHIAFNTAQLNHYTDDGFARFLSGVYQEAQVNSGGVDYSSSLISYRKAYSTYEKNQLLYGASIPSFVVPALLRSAEASGRVNLLARLKKRFPGVQWIRSKSFEKMGHVIFIGYNGQIFHLTSQRFAFPFPIANTLAMVSFSVPNPVSGGTQIFGHRIVASAAGKTVVAENTSEVAEPLRAIGLTNFQDHLKRVVFREAIRSILKTAEEVVATNVADRQGGGIAGLIAMIVGDVANVASDEADTRSWRTLPSQMDYSELDLDPGTYDISVYPMGVSGPVIEKKVTLVPGQFLLLHETDGR